MEAWNTTLFLALNAPAAPDGGTIAFARVSAEYLVYLAALLAVCLWVRGSGEQRGALVSVGVGLLASLAISSIIGLLWYHPRPFAIGVGYTFLAHSPDSSFPSDHVTFLWTFGVGLLATHARRGWGLMLILAGLNTAWARIYVGVHFPLDMVGSLMVAIIGGMVAWAVHLRITARLLPLVERPYEASLRAFHLPSAIFPRGAANR